MGATTASPTTFMDAIEAGATREESADALGVAVLMGGGPGMIYASHAIDAVDQFFECAK